MDRETIRREEERVVNALLLAEIKTRKEDMSFSRNGYYKRKLLTESGEITLNVPRSRDTSYFPSVFSKWKRNSREMEKKISVLLWGNRNYANIKSAVKEIYSKEISALTIRRFAEEYRKTYEDFKKRELKPFYEVIYADTTFIAGRTITLLLGVNDKEKQVIDYYISKSENLECYKKVLKTLKEKNITCRLFVSDGFKGLGNLLTEEVKGSSFQFCTNHFFRYYGRTETDMDFAENLKKIIREEESMEKAREKIISLKSEYPNIKIKLCNLLNLVSFRKLEKGLYAYTNNEIESFNHSLKSHIGHYYRKRENLTDDIADFILKSGRY